MRYEEKAALQDGNKARMYEERYKKWRKKKTIEMFEEKKKQDKLKKYDVNITFLATVQAEDENEAEDEAINLFDWGNVNIKIEEVSDE